MWADHQYQAKQRADVQRTLSGDRIREMASVASGIKQDMPHCQGACTDRNGRKSYVHGMDLSTRRGPLPLEK